MNMRRKEYMWYWCSIYLSILFIFFSHGIYIKFVCGLALSRLVLTTLQRLLSVTRSDIQRFKWFKYDCDFWFIIICLLIGNNGRIIDKKMLAYRMSGPWRGYDYCVCVSVSLFSLQALFVHFSHNLRLNRSKFRLGIELPESKRERYQSVHFMLI